MSSCYWINYIIMYSNHGNKLFNLGSLKQHLKLGQQWINNNITFHFIKFNIMIEDENLHLRVICDFFLNPKKMKHAKVA
jgi:hypothetical protein